MDRIIATKTAVPNVLNWNPEPTIKEVKLSILALIIILNSPNVRIVIGKDKRSKIGLTAIFNSDKTKLAANAIQTFAT